MEAAAASARQAVISWDVPTARENGEPMSPSELGGYEIYVTAGEPGDDRVIVVSNPLETTATVENLSQSEYHFAVAAFDVDGLKSQLSDIVTLFIDQQVAAR